MIENLLVYVLIAAIVCAVTLIDIAKSLRRIDWTLVRKRD
jgi:hypothetical protein